jgi:hypothetical protein
MTTVEQVQDVAPRVPLLQRAQAAGRKLAVIGARALVRAAPQRFNAVQALGSASASVGVFWLWGIGVGLLVTGLAVLGAGIHFERQAPR